VLDREERFRDAVVRDFADAYARGETPIPCVRCNQTVKFRDLVELGRDLGCEALATGHYARRVDGAHGPELRRAADPARDQSYFLFATTPDQLAFSRFPLGGFPDKAAVRAEAARLGLRVAEKPDSQDICFVPSGRYHEVVARFRPDAAEAGEIAHLGRPGARPARGRGALHGWAGARPRRGVPGRRGQALYVAALDAERRRVVVGPRAALPRAEVVAGEVNWLRPPPAGAFPCEVKLRAREAPQPAVAEWDAGAGLLRVRPASPSVAAPGQACVLYDGERVLGGGFIRARAAGAAIDTAGNSGLTPARSGSAT
jgi:tRNA-specific 2-thiouridylase